MKRKYGLLSGFGAVAMLLTLSTVAQGGEITAYTSLEEDDAKVYLDAFAKDVPGI